MKPLRMCHRTKQMLDKERLLEGKIHSLFNRVCNIIIHNNMIIPLISHELPIFPGGVSFQLPSEKDFASMGINTNQRVEVKNMLLKVEDKIVLDLRDASVWDGRPFISSDRSDKKDVNRKLEILKNALLTTAKLDGIVAIFLDLESLIMGKEAKEKLEHNHYSRFILPRMIILIEKLVAKDDDEIIMAAKEIIGFGPGLTPSADDFVAGLMIAMIYASIYDNQRTKVLSRTFNLIVRECKCRTTKISGEMLRYASYGEASEDVKEMITAIFSNDSDEGLLEAIPRVINHGGTSGSDLTAGIYIGCILYFNIDNERVD